MCYHEKQQSYAFKRMSDRFAEIGMIAITLSDDEDATVFATPIEAGVTNALCDLMRWHPGYYITHQTFARLSKAGISWNDSRYEWPNKADLMVRTGARSEEAHPSVEFGNYDFAVMALAFVAYGYTNYIIENDEQRYDFCRNILGLNHNDALIAQTEFNKVFGAKKMSAADVNEAKTSLEEQINHILGNVAEGISALDAIQELESFPEMGFNDIEKAELADMLDTRFAALAVNLERRVGEVVTGILHETRIRYEDGFGDRLRLDLRHAIATAPSLGALSARVEITGHHVMKTAKRIKKLNKRLSK